MTFYSFSARQKKMEMCKRKAVYLGRTLRRKEEASGDSEEIIAANETLSEAILNYHAVNMKRQ